jgi:processive 1,2-diacylglycerol beta-glucosyltransferase
MRAPKLEAQRSSRARFKVLILTLTHGEGHLRVANALREALIETNPDLQVQVVNALAHFTRWFRFYYDSYQIPLKYCPRVWGWIERLQHEGASTGPDWLYRWGAQPLFRFMLEFEPDVVVVTEVGLCELTAEFKRERSGHFTLIAAPTGFDIDRAWAQPEVDLYFVAPGEAANCLHLAGVPLAKLLLCGVPVDPAFRLPTDRGTVREFLRVRCDLPLLVVQFGGAGFGKPGVIVTELKKLQLPLQVVLISGRNQALQKKLQYLCASHPIFRVLGWVDNMHEWITAADLVLGKPGGTVTVEAINSGTPFLAFDPLPGEERRNCDLLERWRVGYYLRCSEQLAPTIARLLASAEKLQRAHEYALARALPDAAYDAARAILRLSYSSGPVRDTAKELARESADGQAPARRETRTLTVR